MANEAEVKKEKKPSKALPGLVFLIGLALIVGGVLMQVGYFGSGDAPVPETEVSDNTDAVQPADEIVSGGDEGTADASTVDFSVHDIQDNTPIPVKMGEDYTYGGSFAMIVSELTVNCDSNNVCGQDGDKVVIKFSTVDGKDYPLTLTPTENVQNLIDVPVSVEEWHDDYVVIKLTR